MHVRVTNLMFPNAFVIPMSREMTITQWHVPIDDRRHYWYAIFTSFGAPVTRTRCAASGSSSTNCRTTCRARTRATITASIRTSRSTRPIPAWAPTSTCTTSGPASRWARSQDRTQEHLGQSDKAITAYRRLLRAAIERVGKGERPLMVLDAGTAAKITGPAASTASVRPTTGRAIGRSTDAGKRKRQAGPMGAAASREQPGSCPVTVSADR